MNTRVKICGITSVGDAEQAQLAGADALGLVLYEKSPRYVNLVQARQVRAVIGPFTTCVALLVNAEEVFVRQVIDELRPNLLQFHGDESPEFCEKFNMPYMRAIRVRDEMDLAAEVSKFSAASAFLCDAWDENKYGGTGQQFDWDLLPQNRDFPLVLAGGLTPDNVKRAVSAVRPYAVDVSGGVESAPGVKDAQKMRQFVREAKAQND